MFSRLSMVISYDESENPSRDELYAIYALSPRLPSCYSLLPCSTYLFTLFINKYYLVSHFIEHIYFKLVSTIIFRHG